MRGVHFLVTGVIFALSVSSYQISAALANKPDQINASRPDKLESLAKCLSEKGYRMYSSYTCSLCRVQRKNFGEAFQYIEEIECNPTAPNNQVELCLEKKIRYTPTWLQEVDGKELKRLEGYQLLEILASSSDCDY